MIERKESIKAGTEIKAALGGIKSIWAKLIIMGTTRLAAPGFKLSASFKIFEIEAKFLKFENLIQAKE